MESMHEPLKSLTLPPGLDDVTGLVEIDMTAIVQLMSDHAQQQFLLTRGQADKFRRQLWNRLTDVLNDAGEDDSLAGGTGTDWYFRALDDAITGLFAGEIIDVL